LTVGKRSSRITVSDKHRLIAYLIQRVYCKRGKRRGINYDHVVLCLQDLKDGGKSTRRTRRSKDRFVLSGRGRDTHYVGLVTPHRHTALSYRLWGYNTLLIEQQPDGLTHVRFYLEKPCKILRDHITINNARTFAGGQVPFSQASSYEGASDTSPRGANDYQLPLVLMAQSLLQKHESPKKLIRARGIEQDIINSKSTKLLYKAERVDLLGQNAEDELTRHLLTNSVNEPCVAPDKLGTHHADIEGTVKTNLFRREKS